jgi:hypothetical protein
MAGALAADSRGGAVSFASFRTGLTAAGLLSTTGAGFVSAVTAGLAESVEAAGFITGCS